jgi:hypothetical protein
MKQHEYISFFNKIFMLFIRRKPLSFASINVSACVYVVSKILPETVHLSTAQLSIIYMQQFLLMLQLLLLRNLVLRFRHLLQSLTGRQTEIAEFSNIIKRARHCTLSWAILIQSTSSQPISLRYISLLSFHPCPGLPSYLFHSGF